MRSAWLPALVLCVGSVANLGTGAQRTKELRMPLAAAIPTTIDGAWGADLAISEQEQKVAGMTNYLMRAYFQHAGAPGAQNPLEFTVYVGYYSRQEQGRSIHSPKNCLPGAGWEELRSSRVYLQTPAGRVPVNEYLLQNGPEQAVVIYWYQGRGRVQANEYAVKLDLVRDLALRHRSDEALVRVLVPVTSAGTEAAVQRALRIAGGLVPAAYRALPS